MLNTRKLNETKALFILIKPLLSFMVKISINLHYFNVFIPVDLLHSGQ